MTEKDFSGFEPTTSEQNGDVVPDYGVDETGKAFDPVNGPRFGEQDTDVPHDQYTDPTPPEATRFGEQPDATEIPADVRELAERARQKFPDGLPNSAAGATAEYDDRIHGRHTGKEST